jgi:hypothetical protein
MTPTKIKAWLSVASLLIGLVIKLQSVMPLHQCIKNPPPQAQEAQTMKV